MASDLHYAGLNIASAIGTGAAAEFAAYITLYENLPKLELILQGNGRRDRLSLKNHQSDTPPQQV